MSLKSKCRSCYQSNIKSFLNLGNLSLTGYFPKTTQGVEKLPLDLGKCDNCGLVQLVDKMQTEDFFGIEYGYESNLNNSMSLHLQETARLLETRFNIEGEWVIDIASNDGTLLSGYTKTTKLIGIDPSLNFLEDNYPKNAFRINDYFSQHSIELITKNKIKLVTSFSVFYDLSDPLKFSLDVCSILSDDGIWVLEQSYLPTMFKTLSFDTICHEHQTFFTLTDLNYIFSKSGFKIFDVKLNEINGGSIQVFVCKQQNTKQTINPYVEWLLDWESVNNETSYEKCLIFARSVQSMSNTIFDLLDFYKIRGFEIFGVGASTKGNVLLQYCELGQLITEIAEINSKKFGRYTPGTNIPIVNQTKYFNSDKTDFTGHLGIILPWHFKNSIKKVANNFLSSGGSLITLLPTPTSI